MGVLYSSGWPKTRLVADDDLEPRSPSPTSEWGWLRACTLIWVYGVLRSGLNLGLFAFHTNILSHELRPQPKIPFKIYILQNNIFRILGNLKKQTKYTIQNFRVTLKNLIYLRTRIPRRGMQTALCCWTRCLDKSHLWWPGLYVTLPLVLGDLCCPVCVARVGLPLSSS